LDRIEHVSIIETEEIHLDQNDAFDAAGAAMSKKLVGRERFGLDRIGVEIGRERVIVGDRWPYMHVGIDPGRERLLESPGAEGRFW
jgi:hypothetical protein